MTSSNGRGDLPPVVAALAVVALMAAALVGLLTVHPSGTGVADGLVRLRPDTSPAPTTAPGTSAPATGAPAATTAATPAAPAALAPATDASSRSAPVQPLDPPVGFGAGTTGGSGGALYRVTSGADNAGHPAPGTLRYGLALRRPLWIVFSADVTIRFAAAMPVMPDKTIDGRGHRVVLTGHGKPGLQLYGTHNVVVENVTLRDFGDTSRTAQNDTADAVDISASRDIWIDHCTVERAGDKLISTESGATAITVSWSRFGDQQQAMQIGALATARQDARTRVTVHHNWFDHVGYGTPVVDYAQAHVYDNYVDHWQRSAVRSERRAQVYLERNVFDAGSSPRAALVDPARRCNDSGRLCDGRPGFLADVDNDITGTARIRTSGAGTVFTPSDDYRYTADVPDPTLVARITASAGALPRG